MTYYKDLNSLFKAMQIDVHDVMDKHVFDDVVDIQQEEIVSEVYSVYEPYRYDRRGKNDGLMDRDNNAATFFTVKNGVEMLIQNITTGKEDYKNEYITPLIVGGDGANGMEYSFKTNRDNTASNYLQSRDFISSTKNRLSRTLEHSESLKRGLSSRGYSFYK